MALLVSLAGDGGVGGDLNLLRMPTGEMTFRLYEAKSNTRKGFPDILIPPDALADVFIMLRFTYAPLIL